MNRKQAIEYLTRCADRTGTHYYGGHSVDADDCPICHGTNDAGHLATPCSRYGYTCIEVAPHAYRDAVLTDAGPTWHHARIGADVSADQLNAAMSLVVNDSPDPESRLREYAATIAGADIDAMLTGYLTCQLWAQSDYDRPSCDCHATDPSGACHNEMLDANYDISDIDADYRDRLRDELAELVASHPLAVRMYLRAGNRDYRVRAGYEFDRSELFGHDLYLTREHHGAGFWDRGLGELGDYLTDIAHSLGAADDLSDNGNGTLTA